MNPLLVVEEDPESLRRMKELLRDRYCALYCRTTADAVAMLAGFQPHLILLDVTRRPADAIDFLRTCRQFPNYAETPVLAVMANPGEADIRSFLAAGFQAVVSRPASDPSPLYRAIDHFSRAGEGPGAGPPEAQGIWTTAADLPP
ncbi:MAG TPA: response regulator [Planctomycetota bacterium]|nr:response regulator [Planctomycetota bacterium]